MAHHPERERPSRTVVRHAARRPPVPIVSFSKGIMDRPDALSLVLVCVVTVFTLAILSQPISGTARNAALRRFQLSGWPVLLWSVFQPVPSMYNFENAWEVILPDTAGDDCRTTLRGAINHHVFNTILLRRSTLERCGLPAEVRYRSSYRGTTVETRYLVTHGPGVHGLTVRPRQALPR